MDDVGGEIQLISDGDGLAVIGDPTAVERFLQSEGLESKELGLQRLGAALNAGAGAAQAGSEFAAGSGRWVKLTKESARLVEKHGLRQSSKSGVSTGVLKGKQGQVKGFVEFTRTASPGTLLTNPALLSGAAGIMAQLAMKQAMDEITDYLATIDQKVDDVLRAQKDAVLADMIGVEFVITEAMTIRDRMGKVTEITWSKVQGTSMTIARTQAYALRQLDAYADNLEREKKVSDLADVAKEAQAKVQEWLAVLARCMQLQDGLAVLELDRVLDADPVELEAHRLGVKVARADRVELIARCTERLVERIDAAAGTANAKVLLNPQSSREVVQASNHVGAAVLEFRGKLGIVDSERAALEARRWSSAAAEARDKALDKGEGGVDAARRLGAKALDGAKNAGGKLGDKTVSGAKTAGSRLGGKLPGRFGRGIGDSPADAVPAEPSE